MIEMNQLAEKCFSGGFLSGIRDTTTHRQVRRFIKLGNLPLGYLFRSIYAKKIDVVSNKVMFTNFQNEFSDNQKYIALEMLREKLPMELVFSVSQEVMEQHPHIPEGIRLVVRDSAEFFYEVMSSKIVFDNAFASIWLPTPKRKNQYLINTWHGSMGLKRIDKSSMKKRYWNHVASKADGLYDYMISNSQFEDKVYRTTHWPTTEIKKFGHPRNDVFFETNEANQEIVEKIYQYFGIDTDTKIALYAPTFRRDKNREDCYDVDFEHLHEALVERFGGKWVVLIRHHFQNRKTDILDYKENQKIMDATGYPDMQELMIATDVGISDYSSWVCDYVLSGKPVFLFTVDLAEYEADRGFYYSLEDTPFQICMNNEELMEKVRGFDEETYREKSETFLSQMGCVEDGHAAERTAKFCMELINAEK